MSNSKRFVIVGNEKYGLYYGWTDLPQEQQDAQVARDHAIRLNDVRHIARWYGKTGGITSLAAHGPCGNSDSKASESRIGAPSPSSLLTGVVNVFDCTEEAVKAFDRIEAHG